MCTNPNTAEPEKPRRRWFQFRLRTLLVVMGSWRSAHTMAARRMAACAAKLCQLSRLVGERNRSPAGSPLERTLLCADARLASLGRLCHCHRRVAITGADAPEKNRARGPRTILGRYSDGREVQPMGQRRRLTTQLWTVTGYSSRLTSRRMRLAECMFPQNRLRYFSSRSVGLARGVGYDGRMNRSLLSPYLQLNYGRLELRGQM